MYPPSISATVPARAALAGNPSDGHGGAVVSTVVPAVSATVTVRPATRLEVGGTELSYASAAELSERVRTEGCGQVQPLVPAAIATLHRHLAARIEGVRVDVRSTIPRSVGLAGSSAIVIATMRALMLFHTQHDWAHDLAAKPHLLASLALEAERDVLAISAGLQDRVVQTYGGTVSMKFAPHHTSLVHGLEVGTYRTLGALPGHLFVACRPGSAAESGAVHSAIDRSDPDVIATMLRLADAAHSAEQAIDAGDSIALGDAMDATYQSRASMMTLDPAHVEMITLAHAAGASANYTGSGGAIIVLAADSATAERTRKTLETNLGCTIIAVAPDQACDAER
jgi:glucuronokinase